MKSLNQRDAFFWWGCFCCFLVAMDIFVNLGDWTEIFWFCPVVAAFLAWGLFKRNALIITGCLILAIPGQGMWMLDFILELLGMGMGRTAELKECGEFIFWGSAIVHASLVPISAWGVWKLGFHKKALVPALLTVSALLVATFLLTPAYRNVNCVFFPCDAVDPGEGYVSYFLMRSIWICNAMPALFYVILRYLYRDRLYCEENDAKYA